MSPWGQLNEQPDENRASQQIDKGLLTFAIEKVQITLIIGFFPPQKLGWMGRFRIYSVYLNLSLDKQ